MMTDTLNKVKVTASFFRTTLSMTKEPVYGQFRVKN